MLCAGFQRHLGRAAGQEQCGARQHRHTQVRTCTLHGMQQLAMLQASEFTTQASAVDNASSSQPVAHLAQSARLLAHHRRHALHTPHTLCLPAPPHRFLTCWTPHINIFKDPRWGRGSETFGEDPALTAAFAQNIVRGLQGDNPSFTKVC